MGDYEAALRQGRRYHEDLAARCASAPAGSACRDRLAQLRIILGQIYAALGDAAAAREMLRLAIAAGPRLPDPYMEMARIERERFGDPGASRQALEQGLAAVATPDVGRLRAELARQEPTR
jgi:Tfp pilus assembly protein PilF